MEDRWLSVEEIADYLGLSKDTVYAWITTKGMPAHRVGRLWKFKKDAVDAWVQCDGAEAGASSEPEGAEATPVPPAQGARKPGTKRAGGKSR